VTRAASAGTLDVGMSLLDEPLVHLTVEDVDRMYEVGILTEEHRLELVDGLLYDVRPTTATPEHMSTVAWLTRHLANAVGDGEIRVQDHFLIENGFVSPDLMVLAERRRDWVPDSAELIIEVALSSLRRDRKKAALYARAGVVEYWIAEIETRTLVVHRDPRGELYASVTRYGDGEQVAGPLGAPPVDVTALFG
jgi:Uma2 family endonuclease